MFYFIYSLLKQLLPTLVKAKSASFSTSALGLSLANLSTQQMSTSITRRAQLNSSAFNKQGHTTGTARDWSEHISHEKITRKRHAIGRDACRHGRWPTPLQFRHRVTCTRIA